MRKNQRKDITGKKFEHLTVISMADDYVSPSGVRLSRCTCRCDCGKTCTVNMSSLVTGKTKSCGCLSNTRGLLKDNALIMSKYDFERNKEIDLDSLTTASSKKVWWKCVSCGNSWLAAISSQTDLKKQHGCPYCSGRFVIKGKTDLLSQKTEIIKEWDWEKNEIKPDEVSCFSSRSVFWKCSECGHSWKQTVANRVGGSGCPKCNLENVNSFCEQAVYFYIRQLFPDAVNGDKHIGMELDIYIPSRNIAIEYDGEVWHDSPHKRALDNKKNIMCRDNNIELIRIREPKLNPIDNCKVFIRENSVSKSSLNKVINSVLIYLEPNSNVYADIEKDTPNILEQYANKKYENSLAFCNPEIATEWHPTKNGLLTPEQVNRSSSYMVWWLADCGHEWQMRVADRTKSPKFDKSRNIWIKPQGCPYCSGKRVLIGFNDLQTKYPDIASEWHPIKNGELKPTDITCGSTKRVWWCCYKGHVWQTSPNKRCLRHDGCPICREEKRSPSVICVETNQVFKNAKEAARWAKINDNRSIYKCCRNKVKTAGGYHWKYAD